MPNTPSRGPVLPGGRHLVVFVNCEEPDPDTPSMSSKSWMVDSYMDAMRLIHEQIMDPEFLADTRCQFEVFDEFLDCVTDRTLVDDFFRERWDSELEESELVDLTGRTPDLTLNQEEIAKLIEEERQEREIPYTPQDIEKPKPKEVIFDEIKVEDNRK